MSFTKKKSRHFRISPLLLIVGIVFQTGACSCGCVEHNYWLQLAELNSEHSGHHHEQHEDADLDHACNGGLNNYFFDNSRTLDSRGDVIVWLGFQTLRPLLDVASIDVNQVNPPLPPRKLFALLQNLLL